jgi:predicted small lipoprotein YifL
MSTSWMKRVFKPVRLVALCMSLVAGCARELPLVLPPNVPAQVFEVGGPHYTLEPSSDGYRALAQWVADNHAGWSWGHYYTAPPDKGVTVRCGTLELQFFDSKVLTRTPQGYYMKAVPPSAYAFLAHHASGP